MVANSKKISSATSFDYFTSYIPSHIVLHMTWMLNLIKTVNKLYLGNIDSSN